MSGKDKTQYLKKIFFCPSYSRSWSNTLVYRKITCIYVTVLTSRQERSDLKCYTIPLLQVKRVDFSIYLSLYELKEQQLAQEWASSSFNLLGYKLPFTTQFHRHLPTHQRKKQCQLFLQSLFYLMQISGNQSYSVDPCAAGNQDTKQSFTPCLKKCNENYKNLSNFRKVSRKNGQTIRMEIQIGEKNGTG